VTLLLAHGVPVNLVSERLGYAGPRITLTVDRHVSSSTDHQTADTAGVMKRVFGSLVALYLLLAPCRQVRGGHGRGQVRMSGRLLV
jgi:hypothetical protein